MTKHTQVKHSTGYWGDANEIRPFNWAKKSIQEFRHKILFQSGTFLDLKNNVSLQAANNAIITGNIVL